MSEQCAGCSSNAYITGADRSERLDGDIDQPSVFGGKCIQFALPSLRLTVDRRLAARTKCRNGIRDGVVETPI